MKCKVVLIIIVLTIVLIAGCKPTEHSKSELFQDYLLESYNKIIPENLHYFIVVPKYGCIGCYQAFIPYLTKELKIIENSVSFIVSRQEYLNDSIFINYEFFADTTGIIDHLPIDIANITVITTKDSKILKLFHLNTISETSEFVYETRVFHQNSLK